MEIVKINDYLEYLKAQEEPLLSSTIFKIKSENHTYFFDVGANNDSLDYLNECKDKSIIISHFHKDHFANIDKISFLNLFQGKETYKHFPQGTIIQEAKIIDEKLKLTIYPTFSSHAKGSLILTINDEYCLLGDATGPNISKNRYFYNAQLLKSFIDQLSNLPIKYFIESHEEKIIYKDDLINNLKMIYQKKDKNSAFIFIE